MGQPSGGKSPVRRLISQRRSQSEVIGVVLVLGMVVLGSLAILALGATAINDTENQLSEDRAEKTLTQFDSKAGLVALGESNSEQVALPSGSDEQFSVNESAGTMTIEVTNRTTGDEPEWLDGPLAEVTLGALEYENDNAKLAYQGGGVFRAGKANGTMISPPEFHYLDGTLTLPVVNISGDHTVGNTANIAHSNETRAFPQPQSINRTNPLDNHKVEVTVQSEYYEGWGHYFEQRTDGEVEYLHDENKATLILLTPAEERPIEDAISATHTGGSFKITGQGTRTDSYNSTDDEYPDSKTEDGNITLAGEFQIGGNAELDGSVSIGEEANCHGDADINGILYADEFDDEDDCRDAADDVHLDDPNVDGDGPISESVESTVTEIGENNHNDDTNQIENNELNYTDDTAILGPGNFYLDSLEVDDDQTLELDTNGEEITIAVEEYIHIEGQGNRHAEIDIQGEGKVRVYVNGTTGVNYGGDEHHFLMEDPAKINTPGDAQKSTQFWIYGKENMNAVIDGPGAGESDPSKFVGVLYAPSGESGQMSEATVDGGEVFGGIVVGEAEVANGGAVHFDKALENEETLPEDTKVVTITFLHITENEIKID